MEISGMFEITWVIEHIDGRYAIIPWDSLSESSQELYTRNYYGMRYWQIRGKLKQELLERQHAYQTRMRTR